jgi:exosortase/archaeosortase family protein
VSSSVPKPVLIFFVKAFLLFLLWKGLYLFILKPAEVPDRLLTRSIGYSTAFLLNIAEWNGPHYSAREGRDTSMEEGKAVPVFMMDIYRGSERTLRIANVCNGLELMVLYWGFVVCYPASARRKWRYAGWGMVLIPAMNIVRCAFLVLIFLYRRVYLDFSHHFLFNFLIYVVIFVLWYRFGKGAMVRQGATLDKKATVHEA